MQIGRPQSAEDFERYYDLRWRMLRQPWDQPRGSERDEFEDTAEHVWICDRNQEPVGVGRLHLITPNEAQIRYMATVPAVRGRGVGRALLRELEHIAHAKGVQRIVLNAREPVAGFYEKMGYTVTGQGHTLFGVIPHVRMEKALAMGRT